MYFFTRLQLIFSIALIINTEPQVEESVTDVRCVGGSAHANISNKATCSV